MRSFSHLNAEDIVHLTQLNLVHGDPRVNFSNIIEKVNIKPRIFLDKLVLTVFITTMRWGFSGNLIFVIITRMFCGYHLKSCKLTKFSQKSYAYVLSSVNSKFYAMLVRHYWCYKRYSESCLGIIRVRPSK